MLRAPVPPTPTSLVHSLSHQILAHGMPEIGKTWQVVQNKIGGNYVEDRLVPGYDARVDRTTNALREAELIFTLPMLLINPFWFLTLTLTRPDQQRCWADSGVRLPPGVFRRRVARIHVDMVLHVGNPRRYPAGCDGHSTSSLHLHRWL